MTATKTLQGSRVLTRLPARATLALLLVGATLLTLAASSAAAAGTVSWSLRSESTPAVFSAADAASCGEGKCDRFQFIVLNAGDKAASEGVLTLTDRLPKGIQMVGFETAATFEGTEVGLEEGQEWGCSQSEAGPEEWLVTCHFDTSTPAGTLPAGTYSPNLSLLVSPPPPAASGILHSALGLSGAGAAGEVQRDLSTPVSTSPPPFGFTDFSVEAADAAGAEPRAGGHPWMVTASMGFPAAASPPGVSAEEHVYQPVENVKRVAVELPLGFSGDPLVTERCDERFLRENACPPGSRVGTIAFAGSATIFDSWRGTGTNSSVSATAIYNITPEGRFPAVFGFSYASQVIYLYANVVHSALGERLRVTAPSIPAGVGVTGTSLTFWGQPGFFNGSGSQAAFLTAPTNCSGIGANARVEAESWEDPGHTISSEVPVFPQLEGCKGLSFNPGFSFLPESEAADSPTGLNVELNSPQTSEFEESATPQLRDATVTLPAGLSADPALADGLGACVATGPEGINLGSSQIGPFGSDLGNPFATEFGAGHLGGNASPYDDGVYHTTPGHCPLSSTLGTAEVTSPVVAEPLLGHVYLGTPDCAPCSAQDAAEGKLIKLYLEVAGDGVIAKLPGSVSADPSTGRLTASFKENPQLPFEGLQLHFKKGPRAALSTPPTCGKYTTTTDLRPWSAPETPDATPTSSFDVTTGPGGGKCANSAAEEPNAPAFTAGTLTPTAATYSPFVLNLSRPDGSQRIKGLDTTLPAGLTAKLAGVGECSDAQLAAAANRSGAAEKASPSCPLNTEVGSVDVAAGAGPNPFHVQGHAYLSGPYKGAPLSVAIITPAVAGPFDLGTVVVRVALYVNPETAVVTAKSDPLPQILAGIPLDIRSVAVDLSRNQFTLNPTSCAKSAVAASVLADSSTATLSSPFQVGGCSALGFKPKLSLKLSGKTKRTGHPALRAELTMPPGGANIARAQVTLPHSEFLDQAHIKTICTRVQFAAGNGNGEQCPAASIYGHARAITPLLDNPLKGPVYLRSSNHKLPDLVAALGGQISVDLAGKVDTGKNGGIRNTFEVVPDAPVSKFVLSMQGGKKGLLVNSENLCGPHAKTHALAHFVAQNGKVSDTTPLIANDCGGGKAKKKRRGHR